MAHACGRHAASRQGGAAARRPFRCDVSQGDACHALRTTQPPLLALALRIRASENGPVFSETKLDEVVGRLLDVLPVGLQDFRLLTRGCGTARCPLLSPVEDELQPAICGPRGLRAMERMFTRCGVSLRRCEWALNRQGLDGPSQKKKRCLRFACIWANIPVLDWRQAVFQR